MMTTLQRIQNLQQTPIPLLKARRFAAALLPKEIRQSPELGELATHTLQLASVCLTAVEQQFGPDALHPHFINGDVEHNLLATYHNGTHTRTMMMRDSMAYAHMRRLYDGQAAFPDRDLILLIFAASVHDAIQGDGRGLDEKRSADLAIKLMQANDYSYTPEDQEKVRSAILATSFNPVTRKQSVTLERPHPHMQEALAIGDLLSLCRPDGPVYSLAHVVESFLAVQGGYNQIMVTEARKHDFSLEGKNVRHCLTFIGANKPLRQAFHQFLHEQAAFFQNHVYQDPRVDEWFPSRIANINFLQYKLLPELEAALLTPLQAYDLAQERARVLFAT
jgi:hypothetical protein